MLCLGGVPLSNSSDQSCQPTESIIASVYGTHSREPQRWRRCEAEPSIAKVFPTAHSFQDVTANNLQQCVHINSI